MEFLMPPHPLTNFEIQKYYQNEPRFNIGTHWIALFCNRNEIVYFGSFGAKHVPKEIKEIVGNKSIKVNIFRVQANNSVMCGYFLHSPHDFYFLRLFSPHDFKKNNDIILSCLKNE